MEQQVSSFAVKKGLAQMLKGGVIMDVVTPEHARIAARVAQDIEGAATEERHMPRRPLLLPQLLRAINDSETSRRELAHQRRHEPERRRREDLGAAGRNRRHHLQVVRR